jgi:regulation of enolase protein 1 (concanavalin A-like superfamily)
MGFINQCEIDQINDTKFCIYAKKETDFFIDDLSNSNKSNAPFYFFNVDYDFDISVKIKPEFLNCYDAGGILIYQDDQHWIKAAFENTDLGYPSIVTVVTNDLSDDSNGEPVKNADVNIRLLRKRDYFCVLYSHDAICWKMVRYFPFKISTVLKIGVFAQSPIGTGCFVEFENLKIQKNECQNLRNGT